MIFQFGNKPMLELLVLVDYDECVHVQGRLIFLQPDSFDAVSISMQN